MSPSPSTTRWCPTPEQLMILEELYRRGVRNPNASQIQNITAHLAFHGKIHGKNVFYWFQNHKARDRQKLRKKIAKQLHQQHLNLCQPQFNPSYNNILPQGTEWSNELTPAMNYKQQTWMSDLPKDCLMRSYGHDTMMINMDVGPTYPCCRNRPLQTLELFPLDPPLLLLQKLIQKPRFKIDDFW